VKSWPLGDVLDLQNDVVNEEVSQIGHTVKHVVDVIDVMFC